MSGFSLFGVNLSGAEYDPGGTREGTNYIYPSDAEIDYYASKGMTVIRLPFLLERVEPVAGGPLSATELGYIDHVVDYAASKGIDVILDPHDFGDEYGTVIGTTAASNATFANFWGELAGHFASRPNVLFGLMNEPHAVTPTQWLTSANAAIAAIRAAGATTQQILVPGTDWDGAASWVSSGNAQVLGSGIVDPSHNFAFEVHQYLDSDGSGTHSSVVSTAIGVERLTAITQWAEATGNKLFLGEFGVASDPTSLAALNNMLRYMGQHTDVWEGGTYWAGGPWWGSYMYSVEPTNGVDKPQMGVLDQYAQRTIETNGSTSLTEFGGDYYLINNAGTDPELKYHGAVVTAGEFAPSVPIGAVQTATGYDVAWKNLATGQYAVWSTDSSGNFIANISGVVAGKSIALEFLETTFHQDLNGDGTIGLVGKAIDSSGSTSLLQVGNNYDLESISSGTGPELKYGGAPVTAGEFSAVVPIGAEQTASGYDVAWKVIATGQYTVWETDSNGNFIANITGVVAGKSIALESLENTFHQDLNGDGTIGLVGKAIDSSGSTSLLQVGNNYDLENISTGTGPELTRGGAAVTVGEGGNWKPIGAEQVAGGGYDVAWENASTGQYSVWSTNSNGNYLSNLITQVAGNSTALESLETTFHQDLNGDHVIGVPGTFSLQYKGFDYVAFYNGAYENSNSLPSLAQTGANSIEATLDYGIDVATSQVVADPNYTDSLTALGSTIAQAESLGLSVMVRPLIDFLDPSEIAPYSVGDWRQNYQPTNVAAFFASYQQMIVQEAQVAQANGAQMLSIGAELDQLTGPQYLSYWTDIITAVRQVFSGALTYSASWNTASDVSFWSQLNYEGIDNYVPLSNAPNPTLQDLVNGWLQPATASSNPGAYAEIGNQSPIQYFENLAAQSGKPLLFTELGYANDSGAAADPSASGSSPDPTLQAELYQAFFQAWTQSKTSFLAGTYFWEWDPNGSTSNVGPNIDSFSPQNNPALNQAIAGFEAVSVPAGAHLTLSEATGAEGSATIGTGASLDLAAADSGSVKFGGPTGTLILDHSSTFGGKVFNFTGNGSLSGSDHIDLKDIGFGPGTTVAYTGTSTGGMLTVSDAQHHTANIELAGNYTGSTFSLSSDGSGGTIVIDPVAKQALASGTVSFSDPGPTNTESVTVLPRNGGAGYVGNFTVDAITKANGQDSAAWHFNFNSNPGAATVAQSYEVTVADHHAGGTNSTTTQSVTVTIGGAGNDAFVFHPGVGADTIVNATAADTIELDGFSAVTSNKQLASLLAEAQAGEPQPLFQTAHGGHDTLINLGNHDVITLTNVALSALHASDFIVH